MKSINMNANFVISGVQYFVEVSPCSFMYSDYGIQYTVALSRDACGSAKVSLCEKDLAGRRPSPELMATVIFRAKKWLRSTGNAELLQQLTREAAERLARYDAELAAEREAAKKFYADEARKLKARGYTHCVTYVIHPECGDDAMWRAFFTAKPTDKQIAALLKKSEVKDDFVVAAL
jgi:hypothetical protein